MADRLKQIWQGFANHTSARLTSTEFNTMMRPPTARRVGDEGDVAQALTKGRADESDAVTAAFATLHAEIEAKAKKANRRAGRTDPRAAFSAEETAIDYAGLDDRLLSDLAFTEARVKRSSVDYLQYAAEYHAKAGRRKRKKFLGLF